MGEITETHKSYELQLQSQIASYCFILFVVDTNQLNTLWQVLTRTSFSAQLFMDGIKSLFRSIRLSFILSDIYFFKTWRKQFPQMHHQIDSCFDL